MWVCVDDSLPSHLAIWKFIYSVQDSASATASAWGDLNTYVLPAWKLTPPPCIWPGISAVCTACRTWGVSKWLAQNLVQKHVPRERGLGKCIQTKSPGTVRKEFTENLCSCYRLISQLLVKRGWLQTLWLLGIHRRGKALRSPGFALLCFVSCKMKWWHQDQHKNSHPWTSCSLGSRCPSGMPSLICLRQDRTTSGARLQSYLLLHSSPSLAHHFPLHKDYKNKVEMLCSWCETTSYNEALRHIFF